MAASQRQRRRKETTIKLRYRRTDTIGKDYSHAVGIVAKVAAESSAKAERRMDALTASIHMKYGWMK